jgi:hypothetical protein
MKPTSESGDGKEEGIERTKTRLDQCLKKNGKAKYCM